MIKQNPFSSHTFANIWSKHFNTNSKSHIFKFITNIAFYKPLFISLYINIGKNLTKGVSYFLNEDHKLKDFKKNVFLVYDVPTYFNTTNSTLNKDLKLKKIKQYPGYLINLESYTDLNDYLSKTFSKSSKQKFNRYKRRLELCFNIKEKMLIGDVKKAEYDFVFNQFKTLLTKRFNDKQIVNNNLNPAEWDFYYDVVYPLILENKAALYVIYNDETPICVRLLYFSETIIFDAITVFDIDYSKFHIGKISIMKMLEWCFKSNYKKFDFSKGYFDYKENWSDLKYNFEYHIYYDKSSIYSTTIASLLFYYFKTKQYLREKGFNNKLHRFDFFIKNKKQPNTSSFNLKEIENLNYNETHLEEININNLDYCFLKKQVYDFLFLNSVHQKTLKIYKINNQNNETFLLKTKERSKVIYLTN